MTTSETVLNIGLFIIIAVVVVIMLLVVASIADHKETNERNYYELLQRKAKTTRLTHEEMEDLAVLGHKYGHNAPNIK